MTRKGRVPKKRRRLAPRALPDIPDAPDPLHIAYTRGGAGAVMHVVAVDLVRRGFLVVRERDVSGDESDHARVRVSRADAGPDPRDLLSLDRMIYDRLTKPRFAIQLFADQELREAIDAELHEVKQWTLRHRLVADVKRRGLSGCVPHFWSFGGATAGCIYILAVFGTEATVGTPHAAVARALEPPPEKLIPPEIPRLPSIGPGAWGD